MPQKNVADFIVKNTPLYFGDEYSESINKNTEPLADTDIPNNSWQISKCIAVLLKYIIAATMNVLTARKVMVNFRPMKCANGIVMKIFIDAE